LKNFDQDGSTAEKNFELKNNFVENSAEKEEEEKKT
jgi:hypothetical protein